jgi:tetratricopeptide (TPR) repeat protein
MRASRAGRLAPGALLLLLLLGGGPWAVAAPEAPPATGAAPAPGTAAAAPESPAAPRPSVEAIVREADAAFDRGDYHAARRLYQEAVASAQAVHTLSRLALLQSWDGDLRESVANYRRALALAPGDLDMSLDLARVLSWQNELLESIRIYRDLRALHPENARVLLGLGQALAWKGRFEEADAIYRDMEDRRLEPIEAHLGRARVQAWSGDLDRAEHFYGDVLRADPGNVAARIGLAQVKHWEGLDRAAKAQSENIVLDHPDNREARELKQRVEEALRPYGNLDGYRFSDNDSNRVDAATAAYTFMAEPQTAVRIAYSTYDAEFRCKNPGACNEVATGPTVDEVVATRASQLMAGVTSRLIKPLGFHARIGAAREEGFGDGVRTVLVGGGYVRWQVGRRFAVTGTASREPLFDTAILIDRGIKVDTADIGLEYRFRPAWTLGGGAGFGLYSDGNVRESAAASIEWRLPVSHPWITARLDARYRRFNDDKDNGYFDPLRYDSELLTMAIWDHYLHERLSWRIEGTYGRQAFDTGAGASLQAGDNDTVQAVYGSFGVRLGSRGQLEAFYSRSDYALQLATGFTSTRSGLAFRLRF